MKSVLHIFLPWIFWKYGFILACLLCCFWKVWWQYNFLDLVRYLLFLLGGFENFSSSLKSVLLGYVSALNVSGQCCQVPNGYMYIQSYFCEVFFDYIININLFHCFIFLLEGLKFLWSEEFHFNHFLLGIPIALSIYFWFWISKSRCFVTSQKFTWGNLIQFQFSSVSWLCFGKNFY